MFIHVQWAPIRESIGAISSFGDLDARDVLRLRFQGKNTGEMRANILSG